MSSNHSLLYLGLMLLSFGTIFPLHALALHHDEGTKGPRGESANSEDPNALVSVTTHSIRVKAAALKYSATAGYLVLWEEEGKPLVPENVRLDRDKEARQPGQGTDETPRKDGLTAKAKIFYVAYTLDNVSDRSARPITFVFCGGPGEAAAWLHMDSIAPRRVALTEDGEAPPPPYQLVDNEATWLDATDLVFIDPVSTGFSRPMPGTDPKQFHGLNEDIASVGDFIRLYTTRNGRWLSPKFLLGESYGTTRAAGLSEYLQTRLGLYLNGIILVSNALNIQPLLFTAQNVDTYVSFIPTYATTAWYHQRLSPELQSKPVEEIAAEARLFAGSLYRLALSRGDALSAEEEMQVATELARLTGIPSRDFESLMLRMKEPLFATKLLERDGLMVGAMDSRFTGLRYAPGEHGAEEYDPSDEAIEGPFTATFNDYVRRELGFQSDIPYEMYTAIRPWNFGDARNGFPNTAEALRKAMTRNPYLKVWIASGYYDLLTPFFATENVIAGLNLDPARRANVRFTYYPTGHMPFLHAPSRLKMKGEFVAFLRDATHQAVVPAASRNSPFARPESAR
jgi:carboxypeptidase C (cathepsin A)